MQQQFAALRRGEPGPVPPPVDTMDGRWSPVEQAGAERALACSVVGSPETVRDGLRAFLASARPDEVMATAMMFDHAARLRSFEILAGVARDLGSSTMSASGRSVGEVG